MERSVGQSEELLWRRYRDGGDPAAREALIERHLGLVHHVARRMIRGMPDSVELDDLVGMGVLGLIQAVNQFEPERGLAFSTYAVPRVRGAILDELRRQDWVPRSVRERGRQLRETDAALAARLGRAPTPAEVARALGLDGETFWTWREDAEGGTLVSLEARAGSGDDGCLADILPDPATGVLDDLEHEGDVQRLQAVLADLPARDRSVLALYYYEELTLRQIGEILGLTESRISQVRSAALERLRDAVRPALVA